MYRGEKAEKFALDFIRKNYDENAILLGGMNANEPDIQCCLGNIEVKGLPAQFTEKTASSNSYSEVIIQLGETKDENLYKQWIKEHYKNVNYFCIVENERVSLLTPEDFLSRYRFDLTIREKKSGSRKPGKTFSLSDTYWENGRLYHKNLCNVYLQDNIYINKEGEVRLLSSTKNKTYIFNVW